MHEGPPTRQLILHFSLLQDQVDRFVGKLTLEKHMENPEQIISDWSFETPNSPLGMAGFNAKPGMGAGHGRVVQVRAILQAHLLLLTPRIVRYKFIWKHAVLKSTSCLMGTSAIERFGTQ
jgi:hypothetical protein